MSEVIQARLPEARRQLWIATADNTKINLMFNLFHWLFRSNRWRFVKIIGLQ